MQLLEPLVTSKVVADVNVVVSLLPNAFFGGMRRTRADRDQAHHPSDGLEGGSGLGVRRHGGMGTCANEGQVI